MYIEFYKFTRLPFQLTPDARFFFASSGHAKAMAHLTYGLGQGEGFIIITGDIGAGKTTVVENLLRELDSRKYVAAKITNTQLGADDMLRMVGSAFGIDQEGTDKATLLRRFEAFLQRVDHQGQRGLLLVDECQNLSIPALEELRMLSNLQIDGRAPLQSFLLGQPQFRVTLARPELDQLRQRVIASYHLGPLNETETRRYIEHRLCTVGWNNDPRLSDGVFAAIHHHCGGVPRKINALCSRVLLFGYLEDRHALNEVDVDEVARDLALESSRVLPPTPGENGPSVSPVPETTEHDRLSERIAALETQLAAQDRTIRKLLKMAAAFLDSESP
ncbi:MAG TPA: XrtA/PEP-CTERM system-associated ATPase [Stellaceae bacterium]|nr:XrtA/PEP-CTERM system-associated ATPase [Stellaceae bacterium]